MLEPGLAKTWTQTYTLEYSAFYELQTPVVALVTVEPQSVSAGLSVIWSTPKFVVTTGSYQTRLRRSALRIDAMTRS